MTGAHTDTVKALGKPPGVLTRLRLASHTAGGVCRRVAANADEIFAFTVLLIASLAFFALVMVAYAVWDIWPDMPWLYWLALCLTGLPAARLLGRLWDDILTETAPLAAMPVTTLLFAMAALQGIIAVACGGGWHAWFQATTGLIGVVATYVQTIETVKVMFSVETDE